MRFINGCPLGNALRNRFLEWYPIALESSNAPFSWQSNRFEISFTKEEGKYFQETDAME